MVREIRLDVTGDNIHASRKRAGVQGEGNATDVVIAFDESWDGYAKKITWWDAVEENPVERTLTADLLVDLASDTRTYRTAIPAEPLALEGECTLVIDGYATGKCYSRARSIAVRLEVEPAPIADNAGEPTDPTPTQAEQLQAQIDTLLGDMSEQAALAQGGAVEAESAKEAAQAAQTAAAASEESARSYAEAAEQSSLDAGNSAEAAGEHAEAAVRAREAIEGMTAKAVTLAPGSAAEVKKSVTDGAVELTFGIPKGDPGVSGVYVGPGDMPEGYDVQIDPDGDATDFVEELFREGNAQVQRVAQEGEAQTEAVKGAASHPPVPGENGYWMVWDTETGGYVESGLALPDYAPKMVTFEVEPTTGELIQTATTAAHRLEFAVNGDGYLEVSINNG